MRRLLSTDDGHGAANIREEIDHRWPWLKCQVDRPPGAGAITVAAAQDFRRFFTVLKRTNKKILTGANKVDSPLFSAFASGEIYL